jgi:hypothetical protein
MRTIIRSFVILSACIFAIYALASCEKIDFLLDENTPMDEITHIDDLNSKVVIKSSKGYSTSVGLIYVQKDLPTGFKVEARSGAVSPITSAIWTIEGSTYQGTQIWHKFSGLGEIPITVVVTFENKTKETRKITIVSVMDLSTVDPIRHFITNNGDGTYNVLLLFSRERLRHASDTNFFYIGNVSDWKRVSIKPKYKRYVITPTGKPQMTSDVGKYVGVNLKITPSLSSHNIAIIHSDSLWADFSGSAFVKKDNPGLAWFTLHDGALTPQGDSYEKNLPGKAGDSYFRFTQTGDTISGKVTLYFKLTDNFTNAAFVVRQLEGGTYTEPIQMYSVVDHPQWGQIELPITEMYGKVCAFRYGPNRNQASVYSKNMPLSFFYDPYYKNIRVIISRVH